MCQATTPATWCTAEDPVATPCARLRPLDPDDHGAVQALFARHGWPQRSLAGWHWALWESPTHRELKAAAGWVLDCDGKVVGFLGNLPQAYHHQGQRIWGATCTAYLVEAEFRPYAVQLMRAFAAQPGVHFVHSATANAASAPVYRLYKFKPWPAPGVTTALRWVANDTELARYGLQQLTRRWPGPATGGALRRWVGQVATASGPVLSLARRVVGWAHPPSTNFDGSVQLLSAQDLSASPATPGPPTNGHGAGFWTGWDAWALTATAPQELVLDRSEATLRWRLADPDLQPDLALLRLSDRRGHMLGMCLLRDAACNPWAAPKAELVDWATLPGTPVAAQATLLATALRWAAARGLPLLDAKRYTGARARDLSALGAAHATLAPDANWLRINESTLADSLWADTDTWGMTGADADDWFNTYRCLSAPPPGPEIRPAVPIATAQ
jgi:hypothetical protein